jgi:hypothetical protein
VFIYLDFYGVLTDKGRRRRDTTDKESRKERNIGRQIGNQERGQGLEYKMK